MAPIISATASCVIAGIRVSGLQAQTAGEIRTELDAEEAGAALLEAWHGAMLRMKIERSPAPLDRFKRLTLRLCLQALRSRELFILYATTLTREVPTYG